MPVPVYAHTPGCGGHMRRAQSAHGGFLVCMVCRARVQLDRDGKPVSPVKDRGPELRALALGRPAGKEARTP
jgi:hypothetical protein